MTSGQLVYIVDDDADFLDSCRYLLESVGLVVVPFSSGTEFVKSFQPGTTCCLLLDMVMPQMSGMAVLAHIREKNWIIPTIVMTAYGRVHDAVHAMKLGAVEYLEKPFETTQTLIDLVNKSLFTQSLQQKVHDDVDAIDKRLKSLTRREQDVLECVIDGLSNMEICSRLGTAQRTVESQRATMMDKMEADSIAHLVRLVLRHRAATALSLTLTAPVQIGGIDSK